MAIFAILMVTLAPSLSQALASAGDAAWNAICSAAADTSADSHAPGKVPASQHAFEHCPYCALQADLAPPPDPRQAQAGAIVAFRAFPTAFLRGPRSHAAWSPAQPRAPPAAA